MRLMDGEDTTINIARDDVDGILDRQLEVHSQIQEQSQRLLRTLLAMVAVFIAVISLILRSNIDLLSKAQNAQQSAIERSSNPDLTGVILEYHIIPGFVILVISFGLLTMTLFKLVNVLSIPNMQPSLPGSKDYNTEVVVSDRVDSEKYGKYIRKNNREIENIGETLSEAHSHLLWWFILFLISILAIGVGYTYTGEAVVLFDTVLVFVFVYISTNFLLGWMSRCDPSQFRLNIAEIESKSTYMKEFNEKLEDILTDRLPKEVDEDLFEKRLQPIDRFNRITTNIAILLILFSGGFLPLSFILYIWSGILYFILTITLGILFSVSVFKYAYSGKYRWLVGVLPVFIAFVMIIWL